MYKQSREIKDVFDWRIVNRSLWHKTRTGNYDIVERDLSSMNVLWKSKENDISDYAINNNWLVLDTDAENYTTIFAKKNREPYFSFRNQFAFDGELLNCKYLLGNTRKKTYSVNIETKQVLELPKEDYSFYILKDNYALCQNVNRNILSCRDVENNLNLIWLFDISQFGTFRDIIRGNQNRSIYNLNLYNDKIIIGISRAVIALDFKTGELIWKVETDNFNPTELLISGNKCYIAKGVFYMVIDLDNGKKLFETEKKQIEYNDKKILLFRESGITYHDNQIWYLFTDVINDPQRYLASFTPETLELQSIQPIPIYDQHRQPVFDGNRLYVLEDSGTLNIFEKE